MNRPVGRKFKQEFSYGVVPVRRRGAGAEFLDETRNLIKFKTIRRILDRAASYLGLNV